LGERKRRAQAERISRKRKQISEESCDREATHLLGLPSGRREKIRWDVVKQ
jgi:hypothetical protein